MHYQTHTALALLLGLTLASANVGLGGLPHHARGGLAQALRSHLPPLETASPEQYFQQNLDHSDPSSNATYQQRFFESTTFFDGNGPTFLFIGGEGPVGGVPGGFMAILAARYNARLVALEHRFYGKSVPGGDQSTANLKFLTVEQALADVAGFIDGRGYENVFTFGGSYPGALSAWFRVAYPDHTLGSLSSSGVVDPIFNYWQFDEQVAIAVGPECAQDLRNLTRVFEVAEAGGSSAAARTSMGVRTDLPSADFFYMIADSFSMMVQYGHKDLLCKAMVPMRGLSGKEMIKAFADLTVKVWGKDFAAGCFYDTQCLINEPSKWQPTSRSWRWQKCYELAYLQAAPTPAQSPIATLRSAKYLTMDLLLQQCNDIFGSAASTPDTGKILALYGGKKPKGTRIFFSNGSDDPWQRCSLNSSDPSRELLEGTAKCNGCGHCVDLHQPLATDPAPLTALRAEIDTAIGAWLQDRR